MRKLSFASKLVPLLFFASCSANIYSLNVDRRTPSASGLDLAGKNISVVYMDNLSNVDSVFNAGIAEGFAKSLESDYFSGEEAVSIYRKEKDMAIDYAVKDTLVNIAVASGDDIVFVFDSPEFEEAQLGERKLTSKGKCMLPVRVPFTMKMYAYDTMGEDTLKVYSGKSVVNRNLVCDESQSDEDILWSMWPSFKEDALKTGQRASANFLSTWKTEAYSMFYYDQLKWYEALEYAAMFKWTKAIDKWISVLNTSNMQKRAAAEYNIATALYLMGDIPLAQEWLEKSREDYEFPQSKTLAKRLGMVK